MTYQPIRTLTAALCVPFMKITGFSFSKNFRWEITKFHSFIYHNVDVVHANWMAHGEKMREQIKNLPLGGE